MAQVVHPLLAARAPRGIQSLGAKGDRIRDELNEFCQEHDFGRR